MDSLVEAGAVRQRVTGLLEVAQAEGRAITDEAVARAAELACELALELLTLARLEETRVERRLERRLMRLMRDEAGRRLTLAFTDQALRPSRQERVAEQLKYLLRREGIPNYFSRWERLQLSAFKAVGTLAPGWVVPRVIDKLEDEVARVTLPAQEPELSRAIARSVARGARVNLNHLGEAILGDAEAKKRHATYLKTLARDDIAAISIKVSSVVAQLDVLGWERALVVLRDRIGAVYREARARGDKLVTLDMEEYRDLELTFELLSRLVMEEEHLQVHAGVVLQAYLPDGVPMLERLIMLSEWRVAAGGRRLRLRLVKGANLAMERVDASLHGFVQAPYANKGDVDANFKRMLIRAFEAARSGVLEVGVGSHNLFDLSFAMALVAMWGLDKVVGIEMLEGIAPSLQRAVIELAGGLLVYTPTVDHEDLLAAIAYLIRRLDENTGKDNFLRESFGMVPGSESFERERARFLASVARRDEPMVGSRRQRSGLGVRVGDAKRTSLAEPFENEPDTDWTLPGNRAWVEAALLELEARLGNGPLEVMPSAMNRGATDEGAMNRAATEEGAMDRGATEGGAKGLGATEGGAMNRGATGFEVRYDPSRPGVAVSRTTLLPLDAVEGVVVAARAAMVGWSRRPVEARAEVLLEVARHLRAARGELIALMVAEGGKSASEGDGEVSEAIDFAEYYARQAVLQARELEGSTLTPRGVVLVTPPWNFPLAIPAGGVFAALVTGNAVLLKPAPETPAIAGRLAELCWAAGVPRDVLGFVPCANEPTGTAFITHPGVDTVILTGGTATARRFLERRPDLRLIAETGGKNAMIATDMADRDLVIKHVLHSAFNHSGQKCSATSLLILEAPLYDDARFLERLADAARSLHVGSAWELGARVTPLIREPSGALLEALTTLDAGESWLVEPRVAPDNPRLWSPGLKLGVKEGSRTHLTELFGPVLAIMRADDLEHAIRIANAVPYGLTAGIQSLDDRESRFWSESIDAGCLYVNRVTTGAIVRRQPFGGRKASVFGPGAKAGGPNYALQLVEVSAPSGQVDRAERAVSPSYDARWLGESVDPSLLIGQDNLFRYRPTVVLLRLASGTLEVEARMAIAAQRAVAGVLGGQLRASAPEAAPWHSTLGLGLEVEVGPASTLALDGLRRVRALGEVESELRARCHASAIHYETAPVSPVGRVELLRWVEEQTLSVDYHRFGNLGSRDQEARSLPTL